MTNDELDLLETDVLVDTLKRRFDACVLVTMKHLDDQREATQVFWRGGRTQALGLLREGMLNMDAMKPIERQGCDDDEDEDDEE